GVELGLVESGGLAHAVFELGSTGADGGVFVLHLAVLEGAAAEEEVAAGGAGLGAAGGVDEAVLGGGFEGGFELLDDVGGAAGGAVVDGDVLVVGAEVPAVEGAGELVADLL